MPRGRRIDEAWLRDRYPRMTDINELLDDCEREFGWRPSKQAVYVKANRMGLRKEPVAGRADRAERTVRWSKEPEMEAWMLEHDRGQRMDALQAEWREHFGFGISRGQVNQFRARHGTQRRNAHGGGRPRVPVGSERESKDGYIVVKVRPEASVPMSKDNWELKHVHVYERAHGAVPDGCVVYFADGDRRNFDPANLVAVPRRLVGIMNGPGMPRWHDAESLKACIALAELKSAQAGVMAKAVRTCAVCGARFAPDEAHVAIGNTRIRTCPACLAAGRKASRWTRRLETRMDDETLKPCPCCGAPAEMRRSRAGDDFVKCTNPSCGLRTKNCHENEAGARLVWNARTGDAELRTLVRRDIHDGRLDYAARKAAELQAENAALRELVRELWNCSLQYHRLDVYRHEIGVDGCGIGCMANGEGCCACKLEQRMRELGVEV